MKLWLLWCMTICGLSCLAASMSKHQRDIFAHAISARQSQFLYIIGWGIVIASAVPAIFYSGLSVGLSEWVGVLSFAALAVGLTLSYRAKYILQFNLAIATLFIVLCICSVFID
ncbi:DUF3325 domain-containing protein [Acinetobacter larvae]|uniref:DUF3325 domain-containing protein n=1 Tax=Acinetobacter larvae TaxID=1789224 RepID=A0A1B2LZL1_9GAMM|nr:DUF3325 domain-containing protein [Acinetobacter larvae]AOA58375.1 hypothetical protein BFG52_08420 [Acinetobacter larvae]